MKSIIDLLIGLLRAAEFLGLPKDDVDNAYDYLQYNEYGLTFDTIVTQLYEYDIEVNDDFYTLTRRVAHEMKLPEENYAFIKDLIRNKESIPRLVKEEIAKVISSLS